MVTSQPVQPQSVNLTDRIAWQWYLVAAAVPVVGQIVGAIAGVVFMARSKIGPALALWATCFLAAGLWSGIGALVTIGFAASSGGAVSSPSTVARTEAFGEAASATGATVDTPEAAPAADATSGVGAARDSESASTGSARLTSCGNLKVNADTTTCPFAQSVFWEYWHAVQTADRATSISVYSGALARWLPVTCREGANVVCTTEAGAEVRIPQNALAGYTQRMADAYAASHTVGGG